MRSHKQHNQATEMYTKASLNYFKDLQVDLR